MDELQHSTMARLQRWGLTGLALIPAVLAFMGTAWVPKGLPLSEEKVLPALAFRQYAVNMREVAPTARVTAPFAFWNRSRRAIEITKLEPSCGCLAPKLLGNRKDYPPGGQGIFEVHVETAREAPGPHTYAIRVHYTVDGKPFEELVTFRCEIPERIVTVTPPELYFYQLSGTALTEELRVEDHRGKSLKVLEAVSTSPHVKLEIGETEQADSENQVTPIRVVISADLPPGSHNNVITIRTDDPDFRSISIPVFLQGKPQNFQLTSGVMDHPISDKTPAPQAMAPKGETR